MADTLSAGQSAQVGLGGLDQQSQGLEPGSADALAVVNPVQRGKVSWPGLKHLDVASAMVLSQAKSDLVSKDGISPFRSATFVLSRFECWISPSCMQGV